MIVLRAALQATQRHGAEQRRLVAVLAQEIRRIHGPNIPDEIALPMNAMIKGAEAIRSTMLEQLAALDNAKAQFPMMVGTGMGDIEFVDDVYTPEGAAIYRAANRHRLVPDPGVVSNPDTQTGASS